MGLRDWNGTGMGLMGWHGADMGLRDRHGTGMGLVRGWHWGRHWVGTAVGCWHGGHGAAVGVRGCHGAEGHRAPLPTRGWGCQGAAGAGHRATALGMAGQCQPPWPPAPGQSVPLSPRGHAAGGHSSPRRPLPYSSARHRRGSPGLCPTGLGHPPLPGSPHLGATHHPGDRRAARDGRAESAGLPWGPATPWPPPPSAGDPPSRSTHQGRAPFPGHPSVPAGVTPGCPLGASPGDPASSG